MLIHRAHSCNCPQGTTIDTKGPSEDGRWTLVS